MFEVTPEELDAMATRNTVPKKYTVLHGHELGLYNLAPKGKIAKEVHNDEYQVTRVVSGAVFVERNSFDIEKIEKGEFTVIMPGVRHEITNASMHTPTKLWSVYIKKS